MWRGFSVTELEIFARLRSGKTLAEIGAELALGHPAVSKGLRRAEERVGVALVTRRGRRLQLTPAGERVAETAARVLTELESLSDALGAASAPKPAVVSVVAAPTPGSYVLPELVAEFMGREPQIEVALDVVQPADLWRIFERDRYDLGVTQSPDTPLSRAPEVDMELLYEDHTVFFVAPSSPLARVEGLDWGALRGQTLVGSFRRRVWSDIWADLGVRGLANSKQLKVTGPESVKRLVELGTGVGVLFMSAVENDVSSGRFVLLPLELSVLFPFYLASRPDHVRGPAGQLRRFLLDHFQR